MGQRGIWDFQFFLDLADHQAVRMRGQQQLHDSKSRFRSNGREHVGVARDLLGAVLRANCHVSILAEIAIAVKPCTWTVASPNTLASPTNPQCASICIVSRAEINLP